MDKHEYRLKTEQMLQYASKKSYKEAMEIAESIDWKKVKNSSVLCAVSEIYEANGEYEKSRDILLWAYERSSDSRKIIYRLGTLALKLQDVKEAMECYKEFVEVAPKDPNKYILKYKILRARKASLEEQIGALEEFKKAEYVEKWAFELAKLYQEAGMISECLEECDDLILWFSEGKYILKAMELKMQYKPLTPLQREKYESIKGLTIVKESPIAPATEEVVTEEPIVEDVAVEEPVVEEAAVEEPVVAEEPVVEEVVAEESVVEEVAEESAEEVVEEVAAEEPAEEVVEEAKSSMSIEEMVLDWQEQQKENAQMIQAEIERVEAEKAAQQEEQIEEVEEENQESVLPDDIRKLMEELEAESADIQAQKIRTVEEVETEPEEIPFGEEDNRPLLQKVVEQLAALDVKVEMPGKEKEEEPVQEVQVPEEEESIFEQESFEKAMSEAIEEIGLVEESEGIKLGDTQSVALSAKALANAAKVEVPVEVPEEIPEVKVPDNRGAVYDTGFIVQGKYDLEAQSEIGLKAGLTEEQKKLFSYFVPVHGMSEQLVEVLQSDKKCKTRYGTSRIGNILIIGRKGSGKTVLAVDLVKAIQKARKMKQGKVAIVAASSLNQKNVAEIVEKLHGGAIIIEAASKLERKTVEDLCDAMEGQTGELLVVLEDARKPLAKLLDEYPNFKKKFTSQIELPVFINDELVTFGQTYAKENGYKIDEMGILALYSRIDMLQREERIVTVADVKDVVDEAIENANRASVKKFIKKVLGKNKDNSERVILTEEDFK